MVFWRDKIGREILLNRAQVYVGTADDGIVDLLCLAGYHLQAKASFKFLHRLARRESDLIQGPTRALVLSCAAPPHLGLRLVVQ